MKTKLILIVATTICWSTVAVAQEEQRPTSSIYLPVFKKADVSIAFDIKAEGKRYEPTWGLDLAWNNSQNLRKGVNHMGKENVTIGRSSFRVLNPLKDDAELTSDQISGLRERANSFTQVVSSTLPLVLNCDNGYRPNGHTGPNINAYYTNNKRANVPHWAAAIAAHVKWMQKNTKHPIVGVSPFNEPDYENNEISQGTPADERDVAKYLKENYADVLNGAIMAGGNTLNDDKALQWYNAGKQYYDWGNTHQLAGSFDNFAKFYEQVTKDGKIGYDDEMHNTVEAMVGLEYGMTVGIWWGFDSRARGEFCQISSHGVRLAYGEHRNNWTAASVYRHDDGRVKAFVGGSERQSVTTNYQLVSTDRDVYYDGYGPVREYFTTLPGGTGYQKGQTNAERVIDVTWGEDVPPSVVNGLYKIYNKKTGGVIAYTASGSNAIIQRGSATNKKQQWNVAPATNRTGGDLSFLDIEAVDNRKIRLNVRDFSTSTANIIAWTQDTPSSNEQWYLEYVGNGYYYLRCRESALYMAASGNAVGCNVVQTTMLDQGNRDRMLWRFLPIDVNYETEAPPAPTGLVANANNNSVSLTWAASPADDVEGYMLLRATASGNDWNTIARQLKATTFTDNTCRPGTTYLYKVKAIDHAQNASEASATVEATPAGHHALVANYTMEGTLYDQTSNKMDAAILGTANYVDDSQRESNVLRLSSTNQYMQLPYEIASSDELTVAMWVNLRSNTSWQRLFDFGNDTDHYLFLTPNNGSVMRFAIKNGGQEQVVSCKSKLPVSQWKHVTLSIASGKTTIFIDGQEAASSTSVTIKPSDIHPVMNYIGRSQFASDPYLSADIDDVRIYNYALTDADVKAVMAGDEPTAISAVQHSTAAHSQPIYGVDGIRRDAPRHGLNIIDGRKVVK